MNAADYYGPAARRHPSYLTPTERSRFIRSYYQIWGLLQTNPQNWPKKLEAIRLKDLYLRFEMSKLNQSFGLEEEIPPFPDPQPRPGSFHAINRRFSKKREALSEMIWRDIEETHLKGEASDLWVVYVKTEGYLNFLVIWDHWQYNLKSIACTQGSRDENPEVGSAKESFWEDSSDAEF